MTSWLFSSTVAVAGAVITGGWSTVMAVVAEPEAALAAVKRTVKGPAAWPAAGVQVSRPVVLPAPGVNTALLPAGSAERSAVSDVMASPSASLAVMSTVRS